jgi:hypothetical protein
VWPRSTPKLEEWEGKRDALQEVDQGDPLDRGDS